MATVPLLWAAIVGALWVGPASASLLHLEAAQHMVSRSHTFHASTEHFQQAAVSYERKFRERGSGRTKRHPFIVKFAEGCDHTCHEYFINNAGKGRFETLTESLGIVSTTSDALLAAKASHPEILADFATVLPEMKMHPKLRSYEADPQQCVRSDNGHFTANPGADLLVTLHALTIDSFAEFSAFAYGLQNRYNGAVTFVLPSEATVAKRVQEFVYVHVKLVDCQVSYEVGMEMARRPEVSFVTFDGKYETLNRWSRGTCDNGDPHYTPLTNHNFTGENQIIGISDTGLDMFNCFLYDPDVPTPYSTDGLVNHAHRKVIQYLAHSDAKESSDGHGTHVAGSVAGLSYQNYGDYARFNGMAHDAKIAFFDIGVGNSKQVSPPSDINTDMLQVQYATGARIFTNSWGDKSQNGYDAKAQQVDAFMRAFPEALVLFAAGNTGNDTSSRNKVNSPGTCKNALTIGASSGDHESWLAQISTSSVLAEVDSTGVAYFSSPGPTADNRIKPDLLAPGFYVQSASGHNDSTEYFCEIKGLDGTSMATPTAAGFALMVRQYFTDGYYPGGVRNSSAGFAPSGALIKAMMIASAVQAKYFVFGPSKVTALTTTSGPSVLQGYGRLQLSNVLNFNTSASTNPINLFVIGSANSSYPYFTQMLNTGGTRSYTFVTRGTINVRVVLCYTDAAASESAVNAMVNKLSVQVTGTDGSTHNPYKYGTTDYSNVQSIDIVAPASTVTYTVKVTANTISNSPQPFALVVKGEISALDLGASNVVDRRYTYHSKGLSDGAKASVATLTVVLVLLMVTVCYIRKISIARSTVLMNPANYAEDSLYDFEVPEELAEPPKKTLFGAWFSKQPKSQ